MKLVIGEIVFGLVIFAAIGGAIGASLRFLLVHFTNIFWGNLFPYGTMLVNVFGSLLMGVLFVLFTEKLKIWGANANQMQALLMTGVLGGFTTFSAFSLDTWRLIENQAYLGAIMYICFSVLLSIMALIIAIYLTRSMLSL